MTNANQTTYTVDIKRGGYWTRTGKVQTTEAAANRLACKRSGRRMNTNLTVRVNLHDHRCTSEFYNGTGRNVYKNGVEI